MHRVGIQIRGKPILANLLALKENIYNYLINSLTLEAMAKLEICYLDMFRHT